MKSTTRIVIGAAIPRLRPSKVVRISGATSSSDGIEPSRMMVHLSADLIEDLIDRPRPSNPTTVGHANR